ncbi:MAG: hypothetical protein ABII71_01665 [Candidatus Micrarchaeota archaeon]
MQKKAIRRVQAVPVHASNEKKWDLHELLGHSICALSQEDNVRLSTIRVVAQLRHETLEVRQDAFRRLRGTIAWLSEVKDCELLRAFRIGLSQGCTRWAGTSVPKAVEFSHHAVRKVAKDTEREIEKLDGAGTKACLAKAEPFFQFTDKNLKSK